MSVIIELKDGTELNVPERTLDFDNWVYLDKRDVTNLIVDRQPVPIIKETGNTVTRNDPATMRPIMVKELEKVLTVIDPADVLILKEAVIEPEDKVAWLKKMYGPFWENFRHMYGV